MRLLIDTNVILDMIFKRKNCDSSVRLFQKIREWEIEAYITASSVTDIFYIIRKETHDTNQAYTIMENIFKLVSILSVTENDIKAAFKEKWKDFEDCVQYMTGRNNQIDYIITVNEKDYKFALLPALRPDLWIEMMEDKAQGKGYYSI